LRNPCHFSLQLLWSPSAHFFLLSVYLIETHNTKIKQTKKITKENWVGFNKEEGIPRIWRSMLRHSWRSLRCQSLNSCCGFGFGFRMFITFSIPTDPKIENWFSRDRKELKFAHKNNCFKFVLLAKPLKIRSYWNIGFIKDDDSLPRITPTMFFYPFHAFYPKCSVLIILKNKEKI